MKASPGGQFIHETIPFFLTAVCKVDEFKMEVHECIHGPYADGSSFCLRR